MAAQAQDDRGNPISALRPQDIRRAADAEDPARALLAMHLKNAIRVESQRLSFRQAGWVFVAFFAWVGLQVFIAAIGLSHIPAIRLGAFFGGIVILGIIGRELTRRRVSRLVAATAVAEGICGQCCYSLNSVPVDPDGRITCPECGAAWAPERITRPHWQASKFAPTFHDEHLPWKKQLRQKFYRFITATPRPTTLITPDDRGRFINTIDSRLLMLPASRRDELTPKRVATLRKACRRKGRVLRALYCVPFIALGGAIAVGSVAAIQDHQAGWAIAAAVISAFFLSVGIAVNLSHSFLPPRHTARTLIADGLCGSCTRELSGVPPDGDGFTTCPDCGAAWNLNPQTATPDSAPPSPQTPP